MSIRILSYTLLLLLMACDFPEHFFSQPPKCIQHASFSKFDDANNPTYQKLVVEKLEDRTPKEFRYFFKTFLTENQQIYMLTNFRNKNNCFDVKLKVDTLGKLAGMYRVNGKSYPNELYNLKWTKRGTHEQTELIYIDMHDIID